MAGIEAATAEVCGVLDADLSHPPELLPRMLGALRSGEADFVIGSRYIPGGGTQELAAQPPADVALRVHAVAPGDVGP